MKYVSNYINGNNDFSVLEYVTRILEIITNKPIPEEEYTQIDKYEINESDKFDCIILSRKKPSPKVSSDSHFKALPWEAVNMKQYGFCIDATMRAGADIHIPEITIHLLLSEFADLEEFKYRLIDLIYHEVKHVNQIGINRHPSNIHPGNGEERKNADSELDYFLIPAEVEAYVHGMYNRSRYEQSNLDELFFKYLTPFVQSGRINIGQAERAATEWILFALENYPDSKLSDSHLTQKIIDSIENF